MNAVEYLRAMGNTYSADILEATDDPHSAKELSDDLDIPAATCYRRVEELTEVGLLEQYDTNYSPGSNRGAKRYRRTVKAVEFEFNGSIAVSVEERSPLHVTLDSVWEDLDVDASPRGQVASAESD